MNTKQPNKVVARLTVEYASGKRQAIEIHETASFHEFYRIFTYVSARKKVAHSIPTNSRNYSQTLPRNFTLTGLEGKLELIRTSFMCQRDPIVKSTIKIYYKKLYKKLLTAAPNELGNGLPVAKIMPRHQVIRPYDPNAPMRISRTQERESRIFRRHPNLIGFGAIAEVKADA